MLLKIDIWLLDRTQKIADAIFIRWGIPVTTIGINTYTLIQLMIVGMLLAPVQRTEEAPPVEFSWISVALGFMLIALTTLLLLGLQAHKHLLKRYHSAWLAAKDSCPMNPKNKPGAENVIVLIMHTLFLLFMCFQMATAAENTFWALNKGSGVLICIYLTLHMSINYIARCNNLPPSRHKKEEKLPANAQLNPTH